ncbi:MAG: hypothetical protein EOO20_11680 [Chryseobacterium sp.]|nr:MAG: hypothetical protein EOO20_11680 [Chryseobacterium sp.]
MGFNHNRIRTSDYHYSKEDILVLKKDWQRFAQKKHRYPENKFSGRGIVYTAGGLGYLTCAFVSISLLRQKGCELPIELWYKGNEISKSAMKKFKHLDVVFKIFNPNICLNLKTYGLKPLAIISSSFKEVLFMDADNNCTENPEYLFASEEYENTGAIFWPDYWITSRRNSIWKIIGGKAIEQAEQESGQLLVNKEKCWRELQLCLYFNRLSKFYYKIVLGDKDTFRFAWLALKTKFHMIETEAASAGYIYDGFFFGHTMVQHDTHGKILFLHRNLLKWDITKNNEIAWDRIVSFKKDGRDKKIVMMHAPNGGLGVSFQGDIVVESFKTKYAGLEHACLEFLEEWREPVFFAEYMLYSHFSKNRYTEGGEFSIT